MTELIMFYLAVMALIVLLGSHAAYTKRDFWWSIFFGIIWPLVLCVMIIAAPFIMLYGFIEFYEGLK